MNAPKSAASELLRTLSALPAERRAAWLHAAGPLAHTFAGLADAIEDLAMTQVTQAQTAAEMVLRLADASGSAAARAHARRALAQSLAYAGRFTEALPHCDAAVSGAEAAGLKHAAARARLAQIHPLVHLARYEAAITAGESARVAFLDAGDCIYAARADTSIGGVYQKMDRPAEALRHFDRARALIADEPIERAKLDSNRGLALLSLDDFAGAEQAYHAALTPFEAAGLDWAAAIVYGNLAELATRQGRLHEALGYFEQTRRHLDQDEAPAELANILVEQGDALVLLGQFEQAERQYEAALATLEKHGLVREAMQARVGLARVRAERDPAAARALLEEAASEAAARGNALEQAHIELLQAELALADGRYEDARRAAETALARLGRRPATAAAVRWVLARTYLAAGAPAAAAEVAQAGLTAAEALGVPPLIADLRHVCGLAALAQGAVEPACEHLRSAVHEVERVRGSLQAERFRASFHGDRLAVYADLVRAALAAGTPERTAEAFHAVERAKSRLLLEQARGVLDEPASDGPVPGTHEDSLTRELRQLRGELNAWYSRLADAQFSDEAGTPGDVCRQEIARREQRITELEARVYGGSGRGALRAEPADLQTVQARLAAGTALIEYFIIADELLALVVSDSSIRVFRNLSSAARIGDLVQRVHFQLRRALRPSSAPDARAQRLLGDVQRELAVLHDVLLAPLDEALAAANRLLVVPHGPLHALPMHALWNGHQYLLERFTVSYAPCASLLAGATERAVTKARAVVVGVPDERAPTIEAEARAVSAILEADVTLVGASACVADVQAAIAGASVAHLACHGQFAPENPLASGLKLGDRWLTVPEIYDLQLKDALVTLSGCETGRHRVETGDELYGLVRAFLAAGAATLVVSLWAVDDKSATELMTRLYDDLDTRRVGHVAQALQAAQRDLMTRFPHPAYWAPFVVIGDA